MGKRIAVLFIAVLVVAALGSTAGEKEKSKGTAYVGWVTDTHCAAKGAKEGHAGCAKSCVENRGAKYALITPADGKVYTLDPQDKAAPHAGHHVKVTGTVDAGTLKVESIEMTGEQKGAGEKEKKEKDKPKS
jgi:hypothetical protein